MNKSTTEKVKEFHELFEHPIGSDPNCVEPLKIRQLRIKLLFEELAELAEASDVTETFEHLCQKWISNAYSDNGAGPIDGDNVDKVEELDAITDIQYVLDGKKLTSGLHSVTDKAFDLVHENNMLKAHRSHDHAIETANKNGWKNNQPYEIIEKGSTFLLLNKDGKLTKPHDHKKVDLSILIPKP